MSKKSEQFEQMVANVHELLEGQDAEVIWNEKMPDPDNPEQPRQIDVLIRRGDFTNIVECRIHRAKQNVKWIEELIGRRASLNASAVIAVSASGFTSGAIKKAAKYGIFLYDLLSLTKDEVESWAKSIKVTLFFYKYNSFMILLYFSQEDFASVDLKLVVNELKQYKGLRAIFNAPNKLIDEQRLIVKENREKKVQFNVHLKIDGFLLHAKEVREIQVVGEVMLEPMALEIPLTLAYGDPNATGRERQVMIQQYNLGQTNIVHHGDRISMSLDLSELELPTFWQIRFVEVTGQERYYHEKFEIICPQKINMRVEQCEVAIASICL
ncbi:MAG: restriction endonuclease [Chlorobiaceae bacterium]|jgi:hypothetical protein|nr:restriction endonuclease [Chlorobiaceae bacterium]NTV15834.1 restriction endonuclease [Chlorobiaceae bacterium]